MKLGMIIKREFRKLFIDDRISVILIFGIPILYVILFGILYQENSIKYIPTVVYDQDQTQLSRNVIQAFADSEKFGIMSYVTSQEEMEECIREKTAQVSISIPPDFGKNVKKGLASSVMIEVNGSNILSANSAIGSAQEIISAVSAGVGQKLIEAGGKMPAESLKKVAPLRMGLRVLNNPTYAYTNFILAGMGANGLQVGLILVVGPLINKDYRRLDELKEVASSTLLFGKLLVYWLCGFMAFAVYTLLSIVCFHLPCQGGIASLLLIAGAYVFAVVAIAVFVGTIAPDEVQAAALPLLYIMPALLFSGYIWPKMSMNAFGLGFSLVAPIAYMADNIRDLMLNGYAPHLLRDSLTLFTAGIVLFMISSVLFRWRRSRSSLEQR